jgi:hypothetical protein
MPGNSGAENSYEISVLNLNPHIAQTHAAREEDLVQSQKHVGGVHG